MAAYEDQKQQVMEGLLDNEALTDGLVDEDAQSLLHWCEAQVIAFTPTAACTLSDFAQHLAHQARTIARLVTHIADGDSRHRIEGRLQQLTDDAAQQTNFLRLLDTARPIQDYLQALYQITDSQKQHR